MTGAALRIGIVGYGVGGRWFHAPFIEAASGIEIAGVVARSADKQALVREELPGVPTYDSLTEMLASGVDAVAITTPPATRRELVLEAIAAGVAIVSDKPFAPDAATARELRDAAARAGVPLAPFHNRRWDADLVTLRSVLDAGSLGAPVTFTSVFDVVEPEGVPLGVGGGVLSDLGSHLIDQAVSLLGPIAAVYCELDERPVRSLGHDLGGTIDCGFFVAAVHESGARSHLESSKVGAQAVRRLRLVGDRGTYEATSVDVQARDVTSGNRPAADRATWGYEPTPGLFVTAEGSRPIESLQGDYSRYYEQFARAVRGSDALPVSADDAVHVVEVIDAARRSAAAGEVVRLR
jgi:predicted dehydrogenase